MNPSDIAPPLALLPAATAAIGTALLSGRPVILIRRIVLATGLLLLWRMVWLGALLAVRPALEPLAEMLGERTGLFATLAAASSGGLLAIAVALWLRPRLVRMASPAMVLATLLLAAGVFLPDLGQDGTWPTASVFTATLCAVLALALGLALAGRRP